MANIQKRPDGRWRARYRDSHGKEHARVTSPARSTGRLGSTA
jgi:hypothetical protein